MQRQHCVITALTKVPRSSISPTVRARRVHTTLTRELLPSLWNMHLISKAEPGKPSMLERLKFKVLEFHTSTTSNQNPTRSAQPDRYTLRLANELQCIKRKRVTEGVLRAVLSSQSNDDDPYLEYLAQQFPTGEFENWARCQELLPHIDVAYNSVPVTSKSWEEWAQIFTNVEWYLWRQEDCDIALLLTTEALMVRQPLFG